ncbi:MAG: hypothetical protein ACTSYI_02890 [Promethearchaeota archaeon]
MYCYVLDKSKLDWIESESLFLHDIALLIENTEKRVYMYSGPKSTKKEQEIGIKLAQNIIEKFSYEFIILGTAVPLKIQSEIDLLLGDNIDPRTYKEDRTLSMIFFSIFGMIGGIAFIGMFINQLRMIGWKVAPLVFGTSVETFSALFEISIFFLWISMGFFGAQFLVSLLTKRIFLIFASFSVAAISFGAYLYLDKGVFLFPDAPASIGRLELLFHFLWLAIALLILVGITVWSMMTIILHTKPKKVEIMDIDEIRKASRPTILRDKEPVELKEIEGE